MSFSGSLPIHFILVVSDTFEMSYNRTSIWSIYNIKLGPKDLSYSKIGAQYQDNQDGYPPVILEC